MKRISRVVCTLAALLMSLSAVTSADAALLAVSPNNTAPGGFPTWYQDQAGLALQPCLGALTDVAPCGLLAEPGFNPAQPVVFPGNFPSEIFYYMAQSDTINVGAGGVTADVILAIEGTFANAVTGVLVGPADPGATPIVFQRMRVRIAPAQGTGLAVGTYSVTHPFSAAPDTFTCDNPANNRACTFTIDIPAVGNIFDFNGALGIGVPNTMTHFLRQTALPPPAGFIGDSATTGAVAGGGILNPTVTVSGPPGSGSTSNFIITGKSIGMDVQPATTLNYGGTVMLTPSAPQTITVTNTTANAVTFPAGPLAAAGVDAADFVITAPAAGAFCGNGLALAANIPGPAGTCSFVVTFTPNAAAKAARTATIALAPTAAVPANTPPPVTVKLNGTAQVIITTAATTVGHGTIAPDATAVPVPGSLVDFAAPAGSPVTFTTTPSNKKFKINTVLVDGTTPLTATPGTGAFSLASTGAINHTVTADFMPSGDLDADGTLNVNDALKALRIVAGVQAADIDDPDNSAVKVAPLDAAGKPAAINAKATPDIGDVLVILRRVLNLDVW